MPWGGDDRTSAITKTTTTRERPRNIPFHNMRALHDVHPLEEGKRTTLSRLISVCHFTPTPFVSYADLWVVA
jgi:hypothetical protein